MTGAERGFLLLCSSLGSPDRPVLTLRQFRLLGRRALMEDRTDPCGEVTEALLLDWGYEAPMARRILGLLSQERELDRYMIRAEELGIGVLTRISPGYPADLWSALGQEAPAVLFYYGDPALFSRRKISLVGTREPDAADGAFAREAGAQAARQGYTLVSGNARGCDRLGQRACLGAGGTVISFLADSLAERRKNAPKGILYCSEGGFDEAFSAQRALSRNRLIHALGEKVLGVHPRLVVGGTWAGCAENLKRGWSPLFLRDDGRPGTEDLLERGAVPVTPEGLRDLESLTTGQIRLF